MSPEVVTYHGGMMKPILVKEQKCPYCDKQAILGMDRTALGSTTVFFECPNGHKSYLDSDQFCRLITNLEELQNSPETMIDTILRSHNLPACLGKMRPRYEKQIDPYFLRYGTTGNTVEAMVEGVVDESCDDAAVLAFGWVCCAKCDLFDRCKTISGLPQCGQ